jgi:hypothetical protein
MEASSYSCARKVPNDADVQTYLLLLLLLAFILLHYFISIGYLFASLLVLFVLLLFLLFIHFLITSNTLLRLLRHLLRLGGDFSQALCYGGHDIHVLAGGVSGVVEL